MNTPRTYAKSPELEAAVIADPENDLPRLVYADWLDEHDDPHRAAFIRAQCALWDKNPADDDYPDWVESRAEVIPILVDRRDLLPELPEAISFEPSSLYHDDSRNGFHRGFPYLAQRPGYYPGETDSFIDELPAVVRTTTLRGVGVDDRSRHLLEHPLMSVISALQASNNGNGSRHRERWAEAIAKSPCASALRWLHLNSVEDAKEVGALAKASFDRLTRFDPGAIQGSAPTVAKLFAAPWMEHVHRMTAHPGKVQPECAKRFVSGIASLPALHSLHTVPSDRLIEAFGKGGEFPALASLEMEFGHDLAVSIAPLADACFPALRSFLIDRELKQTDTLKLIGCDWFAGLSRLTLNCRKLGDKAFLALAKSPVSNRLRHLNLGTGSLTEKSFDGLATGFASLTMLTLQASKPQDVRIDAPALAKFVKGYANPNLRSLAIHRWPLDDNGLIALANNSAFSALRVLSIWNRGTTWKGIKAILTSPHLQQLRVLQLTASADDKKALAEVLKDPGVMPHLVGWR